MSDLKPLDKQKTMTTNTITEKSNPPPSPFKAWILAIRPKTLFASLGPVILGTSLAFKSYEIFDLSIFIVTLLCALLLQISTNLANDYLDAKKGVDNFDRLGPVRVTQAGYLTSNEVKIGFISVILLSLIFGLYLMILGGWPIIIIGLSAIWFSYAYSGGPFPLSHNGLGEVAAFIFFGPVATMGAHFLQSHVFDLATFIIGSGVGMISLSILAINNLRDRKSDSLTTKKTLAVRFGEKFQRGLCLFGFISSALLLIIFSFYTKYYYSLIALLSVVPFIKTLIHLSTKEVDSSLNNHLANTGKYLFLYSLLTALFLHFPIKF